MRIENMPMIASEQMSGKDSLISRLVTGDIIRAKILEMTFNEAILRLFDGSVLKAHISGDVELEKGQTVALEVKSRTDTTIELKTVKDSSADTAALSANLNELLGELDINADETSTRIAAEFLKYGIKPDADQLKRAAELVKSSDGMDIEKAAYLVIKNIDTGNAEPGTVSVFLGGRLKLGKLLDTLYDTLDKITDGSFEISEKEPSDGSGNAPLNAPGNASSGTSAGMLFETSEKISSENIPMKTSGNIAETADNLSSAASENPLSEVPDDMNLLQSEAKADVRAAEPEPGIAGKQNRADLDPEGRSKAKSKTELTVSDLKKSIEKIFVKVSRELSEKDLDSTAIKNRISDLIKKTEHYAKSAEHTAASEETAKAVSSLNDNLRLLDALNQSNVLYYQIPIRISGNKSNAELYIMNRRRGKKKIDPHDAVVFLSVDTVNLGRVEMLLELKGNGVSIDLRTGSEDVNEFVKANIKELYTALEDCGRKLTGIKYSILKTASSLTDQEKMLQKAVSMKHERIDLRI